MAKLFLDPKDASTLVSNNDYLVYGTTGNQAVTLALGVAGAVLDANVESVKLAGATGDYTYKQTGNSLEIYSASTLVATVYPQEGTAGTSLTFANGSTNVVFAAANTLALGGVSVSSVAASALTPAVTANPDSVVTASKLTLSTGFDNLKLATQGTFTAPIIDNANTLQTGDTLVGSSSDADQLKAVIANSQKFAILANTTGIERVQIQAQANSTDSTNNNTSVTNQVQIDAQNMLGVNRFENNNSRSDLLIEDVRISSSRTGTINVAADNQQVILNPDRTVNVAATNAASIGSWQYTDDITVAMVSTDPGHVDFGLYFDQNSLRARDPLNTQGNSLKVNLLDINGQVNSQKPLENNIYKTVTIKVDGVDKTIDFTANNSNGAPINGTATYADLLKAIQLGITKAGLDDKMSASLSATLFPAGSDNENTPQSRATGQSVILTSKNNALLTVGNGSGWGTGDLKVPPASNYVTDIKATQPFSSTILPLVTSTIVLDDVGRGSNSGNLVVGGLSIGDTSLSTGVNQFNILVDRSSKLEAITSTNNALKEVYIVSGVNSSNGSGIHNGDLTVLGQVATGANDSPNMNIVMGSIAQPVPGMVTANGGSQFNQYGFNDVRVIDASGMSGGASVNFNAAITEASINKYLNLVDVASTVAKEDNSNFIYTGTKNNDTITVALDPKTVAASKTSILSGREDVTLNVNGGAGDDQLTVGVYTAKDAIGNYLPAGNTQAWYINQVLNKNISVNGGDGNDTITTPGAGDKNILGGKGSDAIYSDNTGRQVVALNDHMVTTKGPLATATWVNNAVSKSFVNGLNPALNLNDIASDTNATYNLFLGKVVVKFGGYSSLAVTIPQTSSDSFVTTDLQIHQAIKAAINSDPVLNKLLIAQDGPANTLVVTSLIDGVYHSGDLSFEIAAPTAAALQSSGYAFADIYNAQRGINLGAAVSSAVTFASVLADQGTAFGNASAALGYWSPEIANDGTSNLVGANSVTTSDNLINAGVSAPTGADVVVLGTTVGATELASSNEVVALDKSFGKQVLVHFDATNSTGHDTIDFSNFFVSGAKYSQTPSATNYDVRTIFTTSTTPPAAINDNNLHVILVDNGTFIKVYSVSANSAPVPQGELSVLGHGGQANGGTLVSANTLLSNGVFGTYSSTILPPSSNTVSLSGATTVSEGSSVVYTVTSANLAPASGITVPYTLTGIALADLTGATATSGNIVIPVGQYTGTLTLNVAADSLTEGTENLNVTISQPASGAVLGAVSSILTTVSDTSVSPPGGTLQIPVAAAGTHDAKLGNVIYNVANTASNFVFTIDGFNVGDKLAFPAGTNKSFTNTGVDGNLTIVGSTPLDGQVTINLTGLSSANDQGSFNAASFNQTFGPGSLV